MKLRLHWKRPLFYALLPVLLVLCFVGFPIPLPPPQRTKPGQEISAPADRKTSQGSGFTRP